MTILAGWQDNGLALYGPKAPDGNQYYFSDGSGMRTLATRLLSLGVLTLQDMPIENAAQVTPNRVEQCTQYHCLVIARNDAKSPWSGFISNLGAEHMKASGRVPHALPIPSPVQSTPPDPARILKSIALANHGCTEFTPGDFVHTGRCNWGSMAVCFAAQEGIAPSYQRMVFIAQDAFNHGLCASNGAARIDQVATYTRDIAHKRVAVEWDFFADPAQHDTMAFLDDNAGIHPIALQVANGSAFIDVETGMRDEAYPRLRYHTLAVVGKRGKNIICCDPDHPQVTQRLQVYSDEAFMQAMPCGLMMLA